MVPSARNNRINLNLTTFFPKDLTNPVEITRAVLRAFEYTEAKRAKSIRETNIWACRGATISYRVLEHICLKGGAMPSVYYNELRGNLEFTF